LAFLVPLMNCCIWGQASIPNTPAGHALRAWLEAVNSHNATKIRAYVKSIDSTQTVDWLISWSDHSGGFTLLSVTIKGPQLLAFHVNEKASPIEAAGSIRVKTSRQLEVSSFAIRPIPADSVLDDIVLDAVERRHVIDGINTAPNHFRTPAFDESAKGPDGFAVTMEQVLSGVDALIKCGIVDPDRMALLGFSKGGGITNAILSRTNRFRCAVSVAAIYPDRIAPFFLHGYSSLTELSASGDPIVNPDNYLKLSSVFRANKVETPVLIADGDLDQDFLIGSLEWFNALRREKKKVTLIRYPGQGHGFRKESMQDFWARETEFVDHYLKPTQ
jgi:dienelactone hydrolase